MTLRMETNGRLALRLGSEIVTVLYRTPAPGEVIETLAKKMPRGDDDTDSQRLLMANLELGRECVTGIGDGEIELDGRPLCTDPSGPDYEPRWKRVLEERAPLVLIALGQHLSAPPSFMEGPGLKKF